MAHFEVGALEPKRSVSDILDPILVEIRGVRSFGPEFFRNLDLLENRSGGLAAGDGEPQDREQNCSEHGGILFILTLMVKTERRRGSRLSSHRRAGASRRSLA
jgi:hypothetical protein